MVVTVGGSEYVTIGSTAAAFVDEVVSASPLTGIVPVFGCAVVLCATRSGSGPLGALPKDRMPPSLAESVLQVPLTLTVPIEPVEPTRVTELMFDGDEGPLNVLSVSVSKLLDVMMHCTDTAGVAVDMGRAPLDAAQPPAVSALFSCAAVSAETFRVSEDLRSVPLHFACVPKHPPPLVPPAQAQPFALPYWGVVVSVLDRRLESACCDCGETTGVF